MSQAFNPYREWLDVNSRSETPSYYELLGLRPLEPELPKVEAAYQRQAARITPQLSGGHADLAQRLLGELAEARMTLMTPTAKRAYDAALATAVQSTHRASANQASQAGNERGAAPSSAPGAAATSPAPPMPVPIAAQPSPSPVYGSAQAPGYAGQAAGYGATPVYGPAQGYAAAPVYPGQAYPAWQGQVATPAAVQGVAAPAYYAQPAAGHQAAANPMVSEASPAPSIRPRRARRRSSPVGALAGVAVAVAAVIGGMWFYFKGHENLAVVQPNPGRNAPNDTRPASRADGVPANSSDTRPADKKRDRRSADGDKRPNKVTADAPNPSPKITPPSVSPGTDSKSKMPAADAVMPAADGDTPGMDKSADENPKPEPAKPGPEKPAPDKPEPEKPKDESKPERKASAEELDVVGKLLSSARTALAKRDVSKAQDLIAEATIEATAPDTMADVSRMETLTSYVEMFWDAVRKTLPKIQLEELTINGTMIVVVEADADHLVIRAEGKNHEYSWQKLPNDLARYLADRWLAADEPVRNLVLASFEIVDPKGDRNQAKSLLDAASAAKLNAQPLLEELQAASGR